MSRDFTVLELNRAAGEMLSMAFPEPVWVRGVVALAKKGSPAGHQYFQITDPCPEGGQTPAAADCALFAGERMRISREVGRLGLLFTIEDGMEARFQVSPSIYERNGRFSYIVRGFDPEYTGSASAIHLKRLVEKLGREGILGENGTLPFPRVPLKVGLVTAENSAAAEDFLQTLRESGYPFEVYTSWAPMQGVETAAGVNAALVRLITVAGLDVAVITRGGGSTTDLAWFNDESIARTIAQLPFPVISGIGHETDMTLPDFASHTRAKTPTHAAMLLVDSVAGFIDAIEDCAVSLGRAASPRLTLERLKLSQLTSTLAKKAERPSVHFIGIISRATAMIQGRVMPRVSGHHRTLDHLQSRILNLVSAGLSARLSSLDRMEAAVSRRDPAKMLALGWSLALDSTGRTISSVSSVKPRDTVHLKLSDGKLKTRVERVERT